MNLGAAKGERSQEDQQIMFENAIVKPVNLYANTKVIKVQWHHLELCILCKQQKIEYNTLLHKAAQVTE